ncbi:hypothetical protein [Aeromonas hydrophila]|uniref:hypothetical protein n=1 Tax=Aeromonas hydrophila TaxID=644 RepID=UPI003EC4BC81
MMKLYFHPTESAAKETQLKTETIASICDSFTNAADAARIDEIINAYSGEVEQPFRPT